MTRRVEERSGKGGGSNIDLIFSVHYIVIYTCIRTIDHEVLSARINLRQIFSRIGSLSLMLQDYTLTRLYPSTRQHPWRRARVPFVVRLSRRSRGAEWKKEGRGWDVPRGRRARVASTRDSLINLCVSIRIKVIGYLRWTLIRARRRAPIGKGLLSAGHSILFWLWQASFFFSRGRRGFFLGLKLYLICW